jgi:hypothetical protein
MRWRRYRNREPPVAEPMEGSGGTHTAPDLLQPRATHALQPYEKSLQHVKNLAQLRFDWFGAIEWTHSMTPPFYNDVKFPRPCPCRRQYVSVSTYDVSKKNHFANNKQVQQYNVPKIRKPTRTKEKKPLSEHSTKRPNNLMANAA